MSSLDKAKDKYSLDDHRLKVALAVLGAYVLVVVTALAVLGIITQSTIARNQAINQKDSEAMLQNYTSENEAQHQRTQLYVRCIAQTLLLPITQRTDDAFNKCSVN